MGFQAFCLPDAVCRVRLAHSQARSCVKAQRAHLDALRTYLFPAPELLRSPAAHRFVTELHPLILQQLIENIHRLTAQILVRAALHLFPELPECTAFHYPE